MLIVFWQLKSGVVLAKVHGPAPLVAFACSRDKDGCKANHIVCDQRVPFGATHWRESPSEPWRPVSEWTTPDPVDNRPGGIEGKPMQSKYGR